MNNSIKEILNKGIIGIEDVSTTKETGDGEQKEIEQINTYKIRHFQSLGSTFKYGNLRKYNQEMSKKSRKDRNISYCE